MKDMKNDTMKYLLGGVFLGGIIFWVVITFSIRSNNLGVMSMMGFDGSIQQDSVRDSNSIDAHFIEQMIPHHEDAITMAELALQMAKRSEVRILAQNIIDSQGKEIDQMNSWYKDWFGREVSTGAQVMGQHGMMGSAKQNSMHMGMMGDETDATRLENAADFDREFVEEMIPHHQMAVMMANMLKGGTTRPEMKKLADDIITAQSKEIIQMREWLKDWGYAE